jgi:cell division transport system permease protein
MRRRIARYFALHWGSLRAALARLVALSNLLTVLVIGIALALPAGLLVLLDNVRALSTSWQGAVDITVYLDMSVDAARAKELAATIEARDDVSRVVFVSREQALEEFRMSSGFGEALDALTENPLPHLLVVRPASGIEGDVEALAGSLRSLKEAKLVQLDTLWVTRLRAMLGLARRIIDIVAVLLGAGVLLVIGNTIRLEIYNRRNEIEVVKLVGGSNAFVRRPYLYLGLVYGFAGGAVAAALLAATHHLLASPVRALAGLYGSGYELGGLSALETLVLIGGGSLLGWAGAGLAAARHLRAIEPH